ncbi:hypothetical protein jhhlp_005778 [Lomentospora prolificans]|uniref:Uncharacterized protein n=1 Tax=Lomentospora prolificans TaxID=41688 RepID=A0A2N3N429_9PEZI|nr:hypothetical protein jhhlp_005778 [Lomentospora prolificans]
MPQHPTSLTLIAASLPTESQASLPNLRRLFVEARADQEERAVSRKAFYNGLLFLGSITIFSLIAQKLNAGR